MLALSNHMSLVDVVLGICCSFHFLILFVVVLFVFLLCNLDFMIFVHCIGFIFMAVRKDFSENKWNEVARKHGGTKFPCRFRFVVFLSFFVVGVALGEHAVVRVAVGIFSVGSSQEQKGLGNDQEDGRGQESAAGKGRNNVANQEVFTCRFVSSVLFLEDERWDQHKDASEGGQVDQKGCTDRYTPGLVLFFIVVIIVAVLVAVLVTVLITVLIAVLVAMFVAMFVAMIGRVLMIIHSLKVTNLGETNRVTSCHDQTEKDRNEK
mmetsp:Transcript_8108/g.18816  ORF Transcript_8108/g.18816 Transcript_8108/m.18816 type:complete len:264 (-) Transcript_8108:99-890(-)